MTWGKRQKSGRRMQILHITETINTTTVDVTFKVLCIIALCIYSEISNEAKKKYSSINDVE